MMVLSAMKMETTIYAPHAAVIAEILVEEGEQVMPGQQLVGFAEIESDAASEASSENQV